MARLTDLFPPLPSLQDDFMERVERMFGRGAGAFTEEGYPPLNIWEQDDKAFVESELPGVQPGDIDISVAGADLTITGQRKPAEPGNGAWIRRERASGRFSRILSLPWEIEADSVEATLRDGILTIALSKSPQSRPRKISVQAG